MMRGIGANEMIFLIVLLLVGMGVVVFVSYFLNVRRDRMLKHTERMKALELGRELPEVAAKASSPAKATEAEAEQSYASKCFSTAFWACFWGFCFAGQSGSIGQVGSQAVAMMIAGAAGAVGVTSVICGTVLASRPTKVAAPTLESVPSGYAAKPHFDREEV